MAQFGKADDGTNVQTFSGDRMYLCAGTPSTSGTVTNGQGRVRITATGTTQARMVIYSDSSAQPDAFLAQSDEVTVDFTTSTNTNFPFSGANQIVVTSSTPYWIGFWFNDPGVPSFEMKRDNNANAVRFAANAYPGTPNDPFVADGTANGLLNAAIDYTETSGAVSYFGYKMMMGIGL